MTVAAIASKIDYLENGSTVNFAVPFRFLASTITAQRVLANGSVVQLRAGIDYTTSGGETDAGGTLTLTGASVNGATLRIRRATPRTQQANYVDNDSFPAESHEQALDRLTLVAQEIDAATSDLQDRAVLVPLGEIALTLPGNAARRGKVLGFDAGGAGIAIELGDANDPGLRSNLAAPAGGSSVGYQRPAAGSTGSVAATVAALGVTAGEKGALFDGVNNPTEMTANRIALQAMVDVAHERGVPVILPAGTLYIDGEIDLRGRIVRIQGIAEKTKIKAGAAMARIFNAEEATEQYRAPLSIRDLVLDANGNVTNANISIRYLREYRLDNVVSIGAAGARCVRLRDANNGTLDRVRCEGGLIGLHSEGSNHATRHSGCSWLGATQTGVLIKNNGTLADGNNALLFSNCVGQSGTGDIYDVAASCSAEIVGCYTGEELTGYSFVNRGGGIRVIGGIVYFGSTATSYVARPIGGMTLVDGTQLYSQNVSRGLPYLWNLADAELGSATGKLLFSNIISAFTIGGNNQLRGTPLAPFIGARNYVPRLGKQYSAYAFNATVTTALASPNNTAKTFTCATVTGANPVMAAYATLTAPDTWRDGEPLGLLLEYTASKPLNIRTNTTAGASGVIAIGAAPASSSAATYLKFDAIATAASQSVLEFYIQDAVVGDNFKIIRASLVDADMVSGPVGVLANVGHAA